MYMSCVFGVYQDHTLTHVPCAPRAGAQLAASQPQTALLSRRSSPLPGPRRRGAHGAPRQCCEAQRLQLQLRTRRLMVTRAPTSALGPSTGGPSRRRGGMRCGFPGTAQRPSPEAWHFSIAARQSTYHQANECLEVGGARGRGAGPRRV